MNVFYVITSIFIVILSSISYVNSEYYVEQDSSYFIALPNKVYPDEVVQVYVAILKMRTPFIKVRIAIRLGNLGEKSEEKCSVSATFTYPSTRILQMKLLDNSPAGNYTVNVEGTASEGISGYLFRNETRIMFMKKQVSVLIQLNKPVYKQGQLIKLRVMPIMPNLMSKSASLDVSLVDPTNTTVKRWQNLQTNAGGVLDLEQKLSEQPHYGDWKVRVHTYGEWYEKDFVVNEFWVTAIDVNVSMPMYLSENDFGIAGVIAANLSLGQPAKGTVRIELTVEPPKDIQAALEYVKVHATNLKDQFNRSKADSIGVHSFLDGNDKIIRETRYFSGVTDFMFSMDEIRELLGGRSPANHEIVVQAYVYDWFLVQEFSGSSRAVVYSNSTSIYLLGDKSRTFKPGMPISVYFAVANQDGTPLHSHRRQVTVKRVETPTIRTIDDAKLIVRDDGIAKYTFIPGDDAQLIRLTAHYDLYQSNAVDVYMTRHHTTHGRFLYVSSSTETPEVDNYMVFTVRSNTVLENVHYIVTAASNIVTGGVIELYSSQKTFSIAISRDMIPEARMVVWTIYKGEVLADSLNFFVNGTRLNPVDLRVNRGKDFTGDIVELTGMSDRSAYIGFSALCHELFLYSGGSNFVQETDIINELRSFDSHANSSFRFQWTYGETFRELVHFPAPTYAIDANKTFEFAGLIVFTDANVTRMPHTCNETLGDYPCMSGRQCFQIDQWCDGVMKCEDGVDEMGCSNGQPKYPFTKPFDRLSLLTRHYNEMGDWGWTGHFLMPNGRIDLETEVPDEPMPWVVNAFSISRERGFGMVYNPSRHQATRPFYMRAEAPETIIKGEQIGIRISLFNYWTENLECLVTLHDSDDHAFIVVEKDGIVSSYKPRLLRGDIQTMVYMPSGYVRELHFPVLHLTEGCFSVTISVANFMYNDQETVEMCSTFDGVTNYLNTPFVIDLINKGSRVIPDLEIPVPERFIRPQERQHLYVPGSPEATVGIVGDIVGPGFFEHYLDSENSLRRPFGGGEHNLYNLASNVLYLRYLSGTNQLENNRLKRSIDKINEGLQRQMSYYTLKKDSNGIDIGYFSLFRDYQEETPSIWLTAHALKVFHTMYIGNYLKIGINEIFMSTKTLTEIGRWLCAPDKRDSNGGFIETSPHYNRKMWLNGTENYDQVALSAHVLISLQAAATALKGSTGCDAVISNTKKFLQDRAAQEHSPFTTAILAYALLISGDTSTPALARLRKIKREKKYWADKKIPNNEIRFEDNLPVHQPRKWYDNEAYGVASTGYAMLALLQTSKGFDESFPTMMWLQSMRNSFAGHSSTEDSIIAQEALVEYSLRDMNKAFYQMYLEITPTSNQNLTYVLRLNKTNWVDLQEIKINPVWGYVRGTATGNGIALMQLGTKVNVEYSRQIRPKPEGKFFSIQLKESYGGKNYSFVEFNPCVRWVRPDISNTSGMTVLEMDIPTGYKVTNDVLRAYAQSGRVPTLRRAESYNRKVVFYFDYVGYKEDTCVQFRTDRWFPVANMTIQHKIRVYDYYEPGMHNTSLYTTHYLTSLHICQVCGSFQCPYCPFYNQAPTIGGVTYLLFLTIFSMLFLFLFTS